MRVWQRPKRRRRSREDAEEVRRALLEDERFLQANQVHTDEALLAERRRPEKPFAERFRKRRVQTAANGFHPEGQLLYLRFHERP